MSPSTARSTPTGAASTAAIYCFARPSHAWLAFLSPGLDFETRIVAKPEAAGLLRRELRKRGYRPGPLALGSNTDPLPAGGARAADHEADPSKCCPRRATPAGIVTKSALVLRDLDLIVPMAEAG